MKNQFVPKTRRQIADEYSIDYKTFMRRLKKEDIDLPTGLIYPKFQQLIYESLGYPYLELKLGFNDV